LGAPSDPVACAADTCGGRWELLLVDQRAGCVEDGVAVGRGVGVDPDDELVGLRDGRGRDWRDCLCHTEHAMSPSLQRGWRRCRRRPGSEVTTRQACNGSQPESFLRHWLDMLLIKPSWWARVDAGPRTWR